MTAKKNELYDTIIIGGGGAGLTAAIYAARSLLKTLVLEGSVAGGQISKTDLVENYPGFPEGISGIDISMRMEEQAKKSGATLVYESVQSIQKDNDIFKVNSDQTSYQARSVIIASGAKWRNLNVPGEEEYLGKGVSYCATCDAPFYKGKRIVVVGGGDSAIQETLYLSRFSDKITVIHRRDQLRASKGLRERAFSDPHIAFLWDSVVVAIEGGQTVEKLKVKNVKTSSEGEIPADGVFVFIGHEPVSKFVKGFVDMDESGYVLTNENLETSRKGVFACGEVRQGSTRQLIACCGEGCIAALSVEKYIDELEAKKKEGPKK